MLTLWRKATFADLVCDALSIVNRDESAQVQTNGTDSYKGKAEMNL
jgi:hypothetical protein